jgi:hypothetical protein
LEVSKGRAREASSHPSREVAKALAKEALEEPPRLGGATLIQEVVEGAPHLPAGLRTGHRLHRVHDRLPGLSGAKERLVVLGLEAERDTAALCYVVTRLHRNGSWQEVERR